MGYRKWESAMRQRVAPYSAEAEEYVLSSMIFDADAITTAVAILTPEDFYKPEHAEVFKAILNLNQQSIVVDPVSLGEEIRACGTLENIGGIAFISRLCGAFYTSVNVKQHAVEIKRHAESRRVLKALTDLQNKHESVTPDDLMSLARELSEGQYIHEYAEKSASQIDEYKRNIRVDVPRIYTGFKTIDGITGGFQIPSVVMIGAYPSVGKTAFAINIADAVLSKNPIVFFSLEMSCRMIYDRLAASKMKIDYGKIVNKRLTEQQYEAIEKLADFMKRYKFNVFDDSYYIEQQSQVIASLKPKLVIVDYVQKVKTHHKAEGRRAEIDYISGMYKQIAKQNDCVVVLLSQLSRPDKNVNLKKHRPTMASLKESGALEADGDYIAILHRPYVLVKDDIEVKPEDATILFDKNKFGNVGEKALYFDGRFQRFYEKDNIPIMHGVTMQSFGHVTDVEPNDENPF